MAKKEKRPAGDETIAAYYGLKTRAVDDLVNANAANSPEVSPKELRKYRRRSRLHIPEGLQYFLVKAWFAGVACWFLMIGLAGYGIASLDMMLILGLAVGLLWDLPVNIFIRAKEEKAGELSPYMMFPKTGVGAGLLNALYGVVLVFLTAQTYGAVNALATPPDQPAALGVEPILFGVFVAGWDWLLLKAKGLLGRIVADAKKAADGERRRG